MYRIELRRKVQRSLDKLPKRDFEAVIETVKNLANSPRPKGVEKIKSAGLWRVRQGDYRVVYSMVINGIMIRRIIWRLKLLNLVMLL